MNILVVEDNFLVGEMIRLAVEDADFQVVGPVPTADQGAKLAEGSGLRGALLDINLGGRYVFPLARLLQSKGVPIIFVSGYDRSILPDDLRDVQLVSKPILGSELTRIARKNFSSSRRVPASEPDLRRAEVLRQRIVEGERRLETQRRRVEKLQFEGHDPQGLQLASDLFQQMVTALETTRRVLQNVEVGNTATGSIIVEPITDATIDPRNPESLNYWASEFQITPSHLRSIVNEVGGSSRLVVKALGQEKMFGPPRRSTTID
jgi:DNA-binding response OmpR family regulator